MTPVVDHVDDLSIRFVYPSRTPGVGHDGTDHTGVGRGHGVGDVVGGNIYPASTIALGPEDLKDFPEGET